MKKRTWLGIAAILLFIGICAIAYGNGYLDVLITYSLIGIGIVSIGCLAWMIASVVKAKKENRKVGAFRIVVLIVSALISAWFLFGLIALILLFSGAISWM